MKTTLSSFLFMILGLASAADPVDSSKGFPKPQPPDSPPAPTPSTVFISGDAQYVADFDTDGAFRVYPTGMLKVTKEKGPIRIRGVFADGNGKVETRTFNGKNVYVCEAIGTGKGVQIEFVPFGFKDEKDILTATVDVDAGQGPQPPPAPKPKPVPSKVGKVFVVVLIDRINNDSDTASALAGKNFRKYLSDNNYELDIIDTGSVSGGVKAKAYKDILTNSKVSGNALVILDAESKPPGLVLSAVALPNTEDGLVAAVKTTTGK